MFMEEKMQFSPENYSLHRCNSQCNTYKKYNGTMLEGDNQHINQKT